MRTHTIVTHPVSLIIALFFAASSVLAQPAPITATSTSHSSPTPKALVASATSTVASSTSATSTAAANRKGYHPSLTSKAQLTVVDSSGGEGKTVLIIPINGPIDLGLVPFMERAIAEYPAASAVVVNINTFGGRVDAAVQIRDQLLKLTIPSVAYVDRRAISAGALIALATDQIVFNSGGSMGAATPIQVKQGEAEAVGEKFMSYMRAEMRATAEAKGRPPEIAEAMVDKEIEVDGISPKGQLLTLSTQQALETGIAVGQYHSLDELLDALGLTKAQRITPNINWAERFVRFLTRPEVSGALMSLGLLALAAELYSPGIGLAGGVGIAFLSLFFGGHMVVHLAGWEEVVLCLLGIGFLAAEIFITPGFGVLGVIGLGLMSASMVMALIGLPLDISWETGRMSEAIQTVFVSLAVSIGLMLVVFRFIPSRFTQALVLHEEVGQGAKNSSVYAKQEKRRNYLGKMGVAITDLRPSGKARIDDDILDVSSRHEYINKGGSVQVVSTSGMTIIVEKTQA
ncbi:MAG: hypothetical protein KTR25_19735 [Myxococcales bacterium]|nr:hypothetical protein [Myxococcales bacterium]